MPLCAISELNQQVLAKQGVPEWWKTLLLESFCVVLCSSKYNPTLCICNEWEFTETFGYRSMFPWSLYQIIQPLTHLVIVTVCVCVCLCLQESILVCVQYSVYSLCSSLSQSLMQLHWLPPPPSPCLAVIGHFFGTCLVSPLFPAAAERQCFNIFLWAAANFILNFPLHFIL